MTLTEFLLARIAEDEAQVREDPNGLFAELQVSEKMLAECEAKRRIVQRHDEPGWPGCGTLRALAIPYADHPDFDPTWRIS